MSASHSEKKPLKVVLATGAVFVTSVLGWAAFGPVEACSDPACARERFHVYVEIDAFQGVEPATFEAADGERTMTPASILRHGGMRVQLENDQTQLPYAPESGPLDRADLHQYAQVWRGRPLPPGAHAGLYAMVTPALVSDSGQPLFGIMFDVAGREGFAVAPGETVRAFKGHDDESIALLQLRTFTHELLHALNRRHLDAAQIGGRLTLEAPTRCISVAEGGRRRSLVEAPLMAISPTTIRFFQTAAQRDVLPGAAHTPYEELRTSATECNDVRQSAAAAPALTRWEFMRKRLLRLSSLQAAHAQENEGETPDEGADEGERASSEAPRAELRIQAQEAPYPLGYPIALRVIAVNSGAFALPLRERLAPSYGLIQIERRAEEEQDWRALRPLVLYEPASDRGAMLASGDRAEQTVPLFFGEDGWTFPQPGAYDVRARLSISEDDDAAATSNVVRVHVAAPAAADDRAVLQPLLDENGRLDESVGRLLTFGGRIGSETDLSPLEAISRKYGHTALGSALRLTLVSQQLNPPIDPHTGERPKPELAAARELVKDTCTDSGVAALKDQLLERFIEAAPAETTPASGGSAAAWDGVTAERETVATYSDAGLRRFGPSLHFCLDDASFAGDTRTGALRLARGLRRLQPERIVVIGHADQTADCKYNEELALRRAAAMKRVLTGLGVPPERIRTASLGKRRPLDFSATKAAHLLNRRVEVLIEAENLAREPASRRVLPRCPGRTRR